MVCEFYFVVYLFIYVFDCMYASKKQTHNKHHIDTHHEIGYCYSYRFNLFDLRNKMIMVSLTHNNNICNQSNNSKLSRFGAITQTTTNTNTRKIDNINSMNNNNNNDNNGERNK